MTVHRHSLFVGVDAGGSRVAAVAARDRTIVGHGSGGSANPTLVGVDAAADAIAGAVTEAAGAAPSLCAAFVGAAGAGRFRIAEGLSRALRTRLPGAERIVVESDARIALRAAVPSGPGVVLIAGTGSVSYAENDGKTAWAGGTGFVLGDEGSAFAIGAAAIRLALRAYEGSRPFDEVARHVARSLHASGRDAALDRVYGCGDRAVVDVPLVASLARGVVALAAEGDDASNRIVEAAARQLAGLAADAASSLDLTAPRVAFAGGLLQHGGALAAAVRRALTVCLPGASAAHACVAPEEAALAMARALAADEARA